MQRAIDNFDLARMLVIQRIMLEKQNKELQEAKEEAERANRKKSQFLANMSHELRTPLNAIIGYSSMMERGIAGDLNEKQRKYNHYVLVSGRHLLDMVNDILDVAKIEAGELTIYPVGLELLPFMEEIEGIFREMAADKNIRLSFHIAEGLETLEADPVRLRQILMNLVSNAIKFNVNSGEVSIRFSHSPDKKWIVCDVTDSGIGIPQAKQSELFKEFYQVDSSFSRKHEGTGLGLALTKQLVELHGGRISFQSEEGKGSVFTVHLPVHPA